LVFIAVSKIMLRASFLILCSLFAVSLTAQEMLPDITVKNLNGQIIVSWINNYKIPVSNINIQRSYDSLKNYTTIGSVLNPQNAENGYADSKPPYTKMYYRVFVSFEGGTYLFSKVERPVKEIQEQVIIMPDDSLNQFLVKDNWTMQPINERNNPSIKIQPKTNLPPLNSNGEIISYPSRRIFTAKDNNITLYLPEAETKKYTVKFFDEHDTPLFELSKLRESFLIIEKVNFVHAGWFFFEVYENGKLIEKNKFFIAKDGKNQNAGSN
jgi:hypothetical protein